MKMFKIILILFLSYLFVISCDDVEPYGKQITEEYYLAVDKERIEFDNNISTFHVVNIHVNAHPRLEWRISDASLSRLNVLGIQPMIDNNSLYGRGSGEIVFLTYEYDSLKPIEGTVELEGWSYKWQNVIAKTKFDIVKPGAFVKIDPEELRFSFSGGEKELSITTNTTLTINNNYWGWGEVYNTYNNEKIFGTKNLTIKVAPNSGGSRSEKIEIKNTNGEILKIISVHQESFIKYY